MYYSQPVVGTAVFIVHEGKFLIGKRKSELGDGKWCLPGGHLEFGESLENCGKRESYEELGINIENISVLGVSNDITEKRHFVTVFLISTYKSGTPRITEFEEFSEWKWTNLDNLPDNLFCVFENFLNKNFSIIKKSLNNFN